MGKTNFLTKVIVGSSIFVILECTQLGGRMGDYSGLIKLEREDGEDYSVSNSFSSDSFEIEYVRPDKIFTPNRDGWNDYFEIQYTNPYDALVNGKIYDLRGRLVANMVKDVDKERLIWNGNDTDENPVRGGLYVYQVEVSGPENKIIEGTIILVR